MKYALVLVIFTAIFLYWAELIAVNDLFGIVAIACILAAAVGVATEGYWRRRRERWR